MASVYPFRAITYAARGDVSSLIAPPYDVLDASQKRALIAANDRNIVSIDLPYVPAKDEGPIEGYQRCAELLQGWLDDATLERLETPAMFAYRQSFAFAGKRYQRCGMACCLETVPFGPRDGGGILPHEHTFGGPKADRLALMKATDAQISPIFGLHPDEHGEATKVLHEIMSSADADQTATTPDAVYHEVWFVQDGAMIERYRAALAGEDVFVADGHHRYNTALNYLNELGDVPADHPARRTMFVLVGMNDPGLAIGETHRVLGGMAAYTWDAFEAAAEPFLSITPAGSDPAALMDDMNALAAEVGGDANVLGLIDLATKNCYMATPAHPDPLEEDFPDKPIAWRTLDVALIQHLIVDKICKPNLNAGDDIKWAFPHTIEEVVRIGEGNETGAGGGSGFAQLAVIVRPTPLEAVKQISRAGELMPQKSTYFYPKLATGLFLNPLR